jgi:hypothetical protein
MDWFWFWFWFWENEPFMKYTTAAVTMIAKSVNEMFSMQNTPGGQRLAVATINSVVII